MFKKVLVFVLGTIIFFSMSKAVYAADITITTDGGTVEVPVRYTVDNTSFIITIPAVIAPSTTESSFQIGADYMNLRPDQSVEVTVSSGCNSEGVVVLERQNVPNGKPVATLETTLSTRMGRINENGYLVGQFSDGENSTVNTLGSVSMSPLNVTENTEAGDYCAGIVFKVQVKNLIEVTD
ncbi:MAG: hypothetical protein ACI4EW_01165 [Butyrivibrio sp.]